MYTVVESSSNNKVVDVKIFKNLVTRISEEFGLFESFISWVKFQGEVAKSSLGIILSRDSLINVGKQSTKDCETVHCENFSWRLNSIFLQYK